MRSLLLVALLLPIASVAQGATALTAKGNFLIGGNANLTLTENVRAYGVSPRLGVFVADGLVVGARVSAARTTFDDGFEESSLSQIGADPFVSYFFASPSAAVQPFVSAAAGVRYTRSSARNSLQLPVTTDTNIAAEAAAGALLRLGPNVGLTGEAYYQHTFEDSLPAVYGLRGGIAVFLSR